MNPLITSALFWKGFAIKLIISSLSIIAMAITTGLSGVNDWGQLATTQKVIIVCGIVGLACTNIVSLLDKSFALKVAEQEDVTNLNAPATLASKAENAVDKPTEPAKP